jgi:6-phosphogluconolactonase
MMRRKWAKLAVALPFLLTGCKGFWNALPVSSTGSGSTASGGSFYVLNIATEQVAGYTIDSGTPTPVPGSPVSLGVAPLSMAIAPKADFLYVGTQNGIYLFSIASTGQLTAGNNAQPISGDKAISMVVSPDGGWLIDVQASAPSVNAIAINATTGTLASANEQEAIATLPAVTGATPQVAVSPDGSYVFAAMGTEGTAVIPFTTANADPFGGVGRIPPAGSGGQALSVAVDPLQSGQTTPRLFYVGETVATSGDNSGGLRVFNFSTLASGLKELSGSPLGISGLAPYSILPISTGNYVYVVSRTVSNSSGVVSNTGVIAGFTVAGSSGVYSVTALGSTFAVGTNPVGLAEDSTGTYVLAVDSGGDPDLKGYTFDSTNAGYLDAAISANTGTDPVGAGAIVAVP